MNSLKINSIYASKNAAQLKFLCPVHSEIFNRKSVHLNILKSNNVLNTPKNDLLKISDKCKKTQFLSIKSRNDISNYQFDNYCSMATKTSKRNLKKKDSEIIIGDMEIKKRPKMENYFNRNLPNVDNNKIFILLKHSNLNIVNKKLYPINAKMNFQTSTSIKHSSKKSQFKERYITRPIDSYEKWLGEWKSRQKQRAREEKDTEEKKIRKVTLEGSFKVVAFAMANSVLIFVAKLYAAIFSRSSSMLSEAIHSLADVLNEGLLAWGIIRSLKEPDPEHPYGFSAERYAYALISGVGIFVFGGGVSLYHGIAGMFNSHIIGSPKGSLAVLLFSLISDGTSLCFAYKQIKERAKAAGVSVVKYIKKGNDPTTVQVFLEDAAGVAGCLIAGISLLLASWFKCPIIDSIGSMQIGFLLSILSIFLIKKNINGLVQSSLPPRALNEVVKVLEDSPIIKSVHDVKSVSLGPERERFKAEIQLNGEKVSRKYIDSLPNNIKSESKKLQQCKTEDELKEYLVKYGGSLIDTLGNEIDKLELEIQKKRPQIKHVDLEII